jgi:hypothetical protein
MQKILGICVVVSAISLSLGCGGSGPAPAPETNLEDTTNLENDMAQQEAMMKESQGGGGDPANPATP